MSAFKKITLGVMLASIISLPACNYITGGSDNSEPPMSLSDINAEKKFVKLWDAHVGKGAEGQYLKLTPLLLTNKIITVDSTGYLQATNAQNGAVLWKKNLNQKITQGVAGNESKIFVSSYDGNVIALAANDGKQLWQKTLDRNILNNPYVDSKYLYIQSTDGTLYSLNASSGELDWEYKMAVPDLTLYSTSSPMVWKDVVIAGFSSGKIVAFDKNTGMPRWDYQIAEAKGQSSLQRMVDINADPIIKDGYLYAVSYQGRIVALDLITGREQWQHDLSSISNMAINDKYLYVSDTEGTVWSLNKLNGRVLWKQPKLYMREISGTNFIDDTIVVGDFEGYLHGLAREHGDFIARTNLANSGIRVAPLVKNGIIYVLDNSGKLAAFKLKSSKVSANATS